MAYQVDEFPKELPRRSYPWSDWSNGQAWRLIRGEDFDADTDQFRSRLYNQAQKMGLKVRTSKHVDEDGVESLYIQFSEGDVLPENEIEPILDQQAA